MQSIVLKKTGISFEYRRRGADASEDGGAIGEESEENPVDEELIVK